jgi:hypothetical protein
MAKYKVGLQVSQYIEVDVEASSDEDASRLAV